LCYWTGNLCTLLNLIRLEYPLSHEQNQKPSEFAKIIEDDENFGEFKLHLTKKIEEDLMDQTPLMQFKSELEILLGISYGFMLSLLYKELDELLIACTFCEEISSGKIGSPDIILEIFKSFLKIFKSNGVYHDIIEQFFQQTFYFINGHLLNLLLTHKKYCSMSSSVNLKLMVSELSVWAEGQKFCNCKKYLENLRDISNVLMVDKNELIDSTVREHVCPTLEVCQVLTLLCFYHADEFDTIGEISLFVIQKLNDLCLETENTIIDEFIIQKPFLKTLIDMPSWKYLDLPKELREFTFLRDSIK
jgi:myosin heavy subunit